MSEYKCNLLVPGFARCGTTSLHEYLGTHPEVCMSAAKEPHFFMWEEQFRRGAGSHNRLFANASAGVKWFGESSTGYSVWEPALRLAAKCLDQPRLIVMLRDPVGRTLSHYRWMYAQGLEQRSFSAALEHERRSQVCLEQQRRGCFPWYLHASRYSRYCGPMTELFGEENLLFINSDHLRDEPQGTLDRCFDFLDLPRIPVHREVVLNTAESKEAVRSYGLDFLIRPASTRLFYRLDRRNWISRTVRRVLGTYKRVVPEPTDAEVEQLRQMLAPEVEFFERQFPSGR